MQEAGCDKSDVLVVGFGNPLAGDDGAGPAVVEALHRVGLPPGLRAEDGESDSLRLPSLWRGESEIWLVDALSKGAPPGTVTRLEHDEILAIPQRHATAHLLSLPESLRLIALGWPDMAGVRYRLWGINPASVAILSPMSPAVEAAVQAVAHEILAELAARGLNPRRG